MNVLLINPPASHIIRESLPSVIEDDTGVFPPLGLLYVASYAEKIDGCAVHVLDCQAEKRSHAVLPSTIHAFAPDIVGIQVMTFTLLDAILVAKAVRQQCPECTVVFGGPHPTLYPIESVQLPEVDIVIPGEGEIIFSNLLECLQERRSPEEVAGVLTKRKPMFSGRRDYIQDLDGLQHPARHLIDQKKYTSPLAVKNPLTTIMSSRGCPGHCIFCDRPQMGKRFRMRSAKNVVDEIRQCVQEFGIREFVFYDDTFTINKRRVLDICDEIIADGRLEFFWDIRARVDTMTPEILRKLKQAGCHRIHYGVESGSPRVQRRLKKYIDRDVLYEVFQATQREGIEVLGYFMIGCPDETAEELEATFHMIRKLPMDYAHIAIFTPYPGTDIYREALEHRIYEKDYWRGFAQYPTEDFRPRYWNQYFSDEELMRHVKEAYKHFYSRPGYLLTRLLKVRSWDELKRKSTLGIKLLMSMYKRA